MTKTEKKADADKKSEREWIAKNELHLDFGDGVPASAKAPSE